MNMNFSAFQSARNLKWEVAATDLARNGFAVFDGTLVEDNDSQTNLAREMFISSCRDLPMDRYSAGQGRKRRYGRFVINREVGAFRALPPIWDRERNEYVVEYRQADPFNPEHRGGARRFSSLTKAQMNNAFLKTLILKCDAAIRWKLQGSVIAGVHVVQYAPEKNNSVTSSPSHIHCDGEVFTWSFLLERADIRGGENIIANLACVGKYPQDISSDDILACFTLKAPMEGWAVDDLKVAHYVSPVTLADGADFGYRTMLLIDFDGVSGARA